MIFSSCDMHTHTSCSDGELSPVEFVKFAHTYGVKYFSVTDHDTVDFYFNKEALQLAKQYSMEYITGCEFVCRVGKHPIEILGYGLDIVAAKKYLDKHGVPEEKMQAMRVKHGSKIFKKLGYKVVFAEENKRDPVDVMYEAVLAQESLKTKLLKEEPGMLVSSGKFLRLGLNNPKCSMFISPKGYYPSYKKMIRLIQKKFHGIAVLAHPYHYASCMDEIMQKCVKKGIDGIECYHYTVDSKEKNARLVDFAKQHGLLVTGGSDFHTKSDVQQKREKNMLKIPDTIFFNMQSEIKSKTNI